MRQASLRHTLDRLRPLGVPGADPHEDARYIAQDLRRAEPGDRDAILRALPMWLTDDESPAHRIIALELAVQMRHEPLLEAAIHEARDLRARAQATSSGDTRIESLAFDRLLFDAVARFSTPSAVEFVEGVARLLPTAVDPVDRELGVRAWITLASVRRHDGPRLLRECLETLRRWGDTDLMFLALFLISTYFRDELASGDLRRVLTEAELQRALAFP